MVYRYQLPEEQELMEVHEKASPDFSIILGNLTRVKHPPFTERPFKQPDNCTRCTECQEQSGWYDFVCLCNPSIGNCCAACSKMLCKRHILAVYSNTETVYLCQHCSLERRLSKHL